jgi:FtsP/CotA-like multicopper oxidase with cupredoxin domain
MLKLTSLALGLLTVMTIAPPARVMAESNTVPVPGNLEVPSAQKLLLKAPAQGTQIYTCRQVKDKTDRYEWTLKAPDAKLFDTRYQTIGKHYAGPTWEANDGSKVVATVVAKAPSPDGSIPWLLLQVKSAQGRGILSNVNWIQRLNTKGGNLPSATCTRDRQNTEVAVAYTADYYFYGVTDREKTDGEFRIGGGNMCDRDRE